MSSQKNKNLDDKNKNIQRMAFLLREGHTLLSEQCPQCNSPLFKMKSGDIYCASCDKKVVIVKDEAQIDTIMQNDILDESSKVINMKIKELTQQLDSEKDFDALYKMTRLLVSYLESLEKLKNLKK
jgi:UPF0148 protein